MGKRANVSDMPGGPTTDAVTDEEIEAIGMTLCIIISFSFSFDLVQFCFICDTATTAICSTSYYQAGYREDAPTDFPKTSSSGPQSGMETETAQLRERRF